MEAQPTSWYMDGEGNVIIPAGCTPCCGLADGAHYAMCPNSDEYYSPERERADEPWYGMDADRERYADMLAEAADYDPRDQAEVYVGLGDFDAGGW